MRKTAILLITLFITQFSVISQISDKSTVFNSVRSSRTFSFIDINGDGLLDIEAISLGSFNIFINEGDFKFSTLRDIVPGVELDDIVFYDFEFIDFDADGDKDLIVADNSVKIYENVDGTNFLPTSFEFEDFGLNGLGFIVEDYNSDGYEEFLMFNNFLGDVTIYEFENNSGVVSLKTSTEFEDWGSQGSFRIDLNNDGIDEFARRNSSGSIDIYDYVNNGFSNPITIADFPFQNITKKDMNDDGLTDIIYQSSQSLYLLESTGTGFLEPEVIFTGFSCENAYYVHDYDLDGDFDVLHGRCTSEGIFWQENTDGNFADAVRLNEVGYQILFMREADMNNDGILDIVNTGNEEFLGCLGKNLDGTNSTNVIAARINQNDLSFQDSNGDNKDDLIIHAYYWAGVIESNNDFKGVKTIYTSEHRITDIQYEDIDNDNDQDILIMQSPSTTSGVDTAVVLLENLGTTYSDPQFIFGDYGDGKALVNDDFDNDGDIDIVLISSFKGLKHLVNDGTGQFTETDFSGVTGSQGASIDVTNDGFNDLVVRGSTKLYYYENDTQGSFLQRVELPGGNDAQRFEFADFDQDNDLDLVISDYNSFIKVYSNENSNFTEEYSVDVTSYDIDIADFNNDGLVDIITGNNLMYLINTGDFNFTLMESGEETSYSRIALGQGDDDSKVELVGFGGGAYAELYLHKNIAIEEIETSTNDNELLNEVNVYPNPSSDYVFFEFGAHVKGKVQIFDALGQLIFEQSVDDLNTQIEFNARPNQIYYFTILNEHNKVIASDKIIKM